MADDMFNSVITSGQSAMKYMVLINGGACMATLAFISGIYGKDTALAKSLGSSLGYFGMGVLLAALVSGATYISQCYFSDNQNRLARIFRWIAIMLGMFSYAAFATGGILTILAIK